jgi:hypothetical protein
MTDFFKERTAAKRQILENRRNYRLHYFHGGCMWDSRDGVVEASEAEKIVELYPSEFGFDVVTTGDHPNHRSRYHIRSSGESWLIEAVDSECSHSRIFGASYECNNCGGTGWMTWEQRDKFISSRLGQHRASRTTRPRSSEEFEEPQLSDPAIEQFMTDYFRDRTLAWKKEAQIYGDYVKRFYSPECDWRRWVVSAQRSENEKILNIVLVPAGAQVITRDFTPERRRYSLRPAGQSWLICEVDTECRVCILQGRSADCFWCGGTIWGRKKDNGGLARGDQPGGAPNRK